MIKQIKLHLRNLEKYDFIYKLSVLTAVHLCDKSPNPMHFQIHEPNSMQN